MCGCAVSFDPVQEAGGLVRQQMESTYLCHTPVNDKVGPVHEAAFVTGEEEDCLSLLDGFAEAAGGEVDFAAVALGCVVAEPVLKQGRAE